MVGHEETVELGRFETLRAIAYLFEIEVGIRPGNPDNATLRREWSRDA